jgi:diguanylate cyclase (GGDEF)-like protein
MQRYVAHLTLSFPPLAFEAWLRDLIVARHHGQAATRARAQLIASRTRLAAVLLALFALSWIAVDAVTLDGESFMLLALGRVAVATVLGVIALRGSSHISLQRALLRLGSMRVALLMFYVFAIVVLDRSGTSISSFAMTTYVFLPFVVAAGMGIFPLTLTEALSMSGTSLLCMSTLVMMSTGAFAQAFGLGALWLLVLIATIAAFSGISQLRFLIELVEQSSRDALTGAYTRSFGEEFLAAQFHIAKRHDHNLSLVFLDLDNFKAINDSHGHETGDAVLKAAAEAIRGTIRQQDMLIRWGGEEFMIVLPETDGSDARILVERIAARGLGPRPDGTGQTASVGIAELSSDSAMAWNLLAAAADRRMYLAKRAGRNRVTDCAHLITSFAAAPSAIASPGAVELPVLRD